MKNAITLMLIVAVLALFAMLTFGGPCPPTDTVDPNDYDIDPNLVNYKLMCVIEAVEGEHIEKELLACDPDSDNKGFVFTLQNAPAGMTAIQRNDAWWLTWTASEGVFYVDVTVTDMPVGGDILFDQGSIVFRVYRQNKPPVLGGCR